MQNSVGVDRKAFCRLEQAFRTPASSARRIRSCFLQHPRIPWILPGKGRSDWCSVPSGNVFATSLTSQDQLGLIAKCLGALRVSIR